jgi:hypothetical protein
MPRRPRGGDRHLRFAHDGRGGEGRKVRRALRATGKFGFELIDRIARFPGRCEDAGGIEIARDPFERGQRRWIEAEHGGGGRQHVARACVRDAIGARNAAQGVGELAAAARRAGVADVENVGAFAGDREQRARIVGFDRRKFGTQRGARVGIALRRRKAQKGE